MQGEKEEPDTRKEADEKGAERRRRRHIKKRSGRRQMKKKQRRWRRSREDGVASLILKELSTKVAAMPARQKLVAMQCCLRM